MNTNTNTPAPTISPITADLLAALRAYETAIDRYYSAVWPLRNPDTPDWEPGKGLTPEEQTAFDTARGIIEKQLQGRLAVWANSTDPATQL
jgi:hypothetical protein